MLTVKYGDSDGLILVYDQCSLQIITGLIGNGINDNNCSMSLFFKRICTHFWINISLVKSYRLGFCIFRIVIEGLI